jgi:hypothetical protein
MTENELYDLLEELEQARFDCEDTHHGAQQWERTAAKARWAAITERIRFKLSSLLITQEM